MSEQSAGGSGREGGAVVPPTAREAGVAKWHVPTMDEYRAMHRRSVEDPGGFFREIARDIHWFKDFDEVSNFETPDARWFIGGQTNICYNCVDRHVEAGHGDEVAIVWEGEPVDGEGEPEIIEYTYAELQKETAKFANVLRSRGVRSGDVVTIYMGMVPELAIAMLACVRIGAAHSIVFGGFSGSAIADRVIDAHSRVIVTCDGGWRRGSVVPLKANVEEAISMLGQQERAVESVIVVRRCGNEVHWDDTRDLWWHEQMERVSDECPCVPLDAEHMAFLLYTSGSTGKPKGILHTTAGYLVHAAMTARYTFNLVPDRGQMYWCTADIGWITGHSYIIYGVLPNRVPTLMYEGAPNHPDPSRFWSMVERHKVTQFYTAPTAIRAFMKWGDEHVEKHDLSSLQVLGTVGEPIQPAAWEWYRQKIGRGVCPIVDTWWQTETGGHMLTPLPGATPTKPGSCCLPMFGVDAAVVDEQGNELPLGEKGLLAIRKPWPGMLRGVYGDRQRYENTYWARLPGMYFPGDGAYRDEDGYFWITGRVDDVINVSGHRLGTAEVEASLVAHAAVVEAAVVAMPHEIKGQGIASFVTLAAGFPPDDTLRQELRAHVAHDIGAIAKPDQVRFTEALPKTRSGKIMRRLLRSIAAGETEIKQDTSTLEDFSVVSKLQSSGD
ncbi:MAG: acetate--CoA ligase [Planctomycetota bacterium]